MKLRYLMITAAQQRKREQDVAASNPQYAKRFEDAGHARLLPNVLSGWIAHSVALVIGFVMPRLIDESVGQAALGVWDLGWSLASYVTFSGLGMAAAITHRVARLSADGDTERLRGVIATGFYCQLSVALCLGGSLVAFFFALPVWASASFGAIGADIQWVGLYLGLSIAVGLTGDVAQGVLTGYHRTSWNEYLTIGADIALALAMIIVLLMGGGIVGLALATLVVRLVCEISRFAMAFLACPGTNVRPGLWDRGEAQYLVRFATKTSLGVLQEVVVHQGVRVLLAIGAGPIPLACYSRYQTVIRQIGRLMDRSARVIPPITSDLAGQGRQQEIYRFREGAAKATVMASLPMIVTFAVFGDELILLWMGPDFVVPGVSWALAIMALVHVDYGISSRILSGLNAHGRIAALCFGASLVIFAALGFILHPLSVLEGAWMAAITVGLGVSLPHYFLSCARLGTPPWAYFRDVYLSAMVANTAFLVGLIYSRDLVQEGGVGWAMLSSACSVILLLALYWHLGLAQAVRNGVVGLLHRRRSA